MNFVLIQVISILCCNDHGGLNGVDLNSNKISGKLSAREYS